MDFEQLLGLLADPGDQEVPETIFDDLRSSHTSAVDGATDSAAAKISELESQIAELMTQVNTLKSANWDLSQQIPKAGDNPEPADEGGDDETLDDLLTDDDDNDKDDA